MLGIGMGPTDLLSTSIDKGRSVEMLQTRENDDELAELRGSAEKAFRIAFTKGMKVLLAIKSGTWGYSRNEFSPVINVARIVFFTTFYSPTTTVECLHATTTYVQYTRLELLL